MEKGTSKHQRNHCLEQGLRKGAEMTQKGAPKCKKSLFCAQNRFLRSKSLFERKVRKWAEKCEKGENGLQNTKKSIVYRRVCAMGAKWTPPGRKNAYFCKIPHFGAQNAFWAPFAVLSAKRAKIDLGRLLAPKTCPDACLCFTLFDARVCKMIFVKNIVWGRKTVKIIPCAT